MRETISNQISIHAPRTGSDVENVPKLKWTALFQSTLPARGATHHWERVGMGADHFNPRSPHGERRYRDATRTNERRFQSTLPARGATGQPRQNGETKVFQSTLPARGATCAGAFSSSTRARFQSTLPARGATGDNCKWVSLRTFQSTLPARGATG